MKYNSKQQLESLVKRLLQEELEMHIKHLREGEKEDRLAKSRAQSKMKDSREDLLVKSRTKTKAGDSKEDRLAQSRADLKMKDSKEDRLSKARQKSKAKLNMGDSREDLLSKSRADLKTPEDSPEDSPEAKRADLLGKSRSDSKATDSYKEPESSEPSKEPVKKDAKLEVGDSFKSPSGTLYTVVGIEGDSYLIDKVEKGKDTPQKGISKIEDIDSFVDSQNIKIIKAGDSSKDEEPDQSQDNKEEEPATEETPEEEASKEKGATAWEKIKYAVAKVGGRYKVNGKLFGKKKIRKEEQEKIKALLEKESNKVLKDVNDKIKQSFPEFPNNESAKDFLSGVENLAAVYDTIVKGTEEGKVPVDVSNQMIHDLRDYVKNLLDVELKAFYATVDEQKEHDEYEDMLLEDAAADLRAKLKADREKRGGDTKGTSKFFGLIKKGPEDEFQSTKMTTLRSNKLPLTLAGVGTALGGFSWLVNTDWFKRLFDIVTPENYTKLVPEESKEIFKIKEGDGVYKFLSKTTGINLDANENPKNLVDAFKQIGGGDANKGIELLCQKGGVMMRPEDAEKGLKELIKNPEQYKNLGQFFRGESIGTGKLSPIDTTLYGTISGKQMVATIVKMVPKIFTRSATKTGAGYAIAKGFGSVLGPIGVGLLIAGATVKLMRMKGLKSSRAATLNALYQSLRDIPGGEIVPTEGQVDTSIKPGTPDLGTEQTGPQGGATGAAGATGDAGASDTTSGKSDSSKKKGEIKPTDDDDLYNTLKQVFRFVVNNRRSLGVRSSDKVGMGAAERRKAPGATKADSDVKTPETTTEVPAPGTTYDYTVTRNKKETPMKIEIGGKDDSGKYIVVVTNKTTNSKKTVKKTADEIIKIAQKHGGKKALAEAKYVKDEDVKKYLRSALSFNKLEAFEEFMTKIEALRNKIRNAPNKPKDSTFNRLIAEFDKNPIMLTNISDLFEVDSKNQKELSSLKAFIDDIFISLYSTRVKKGRENIIDKMASVGGGNLNALLEAYYGAADPNDSFIKDAQSRDRFKNNLIKFMEDAIRLFQHLYSKKRNK